MAKDKWLAKNEAKTGHDWEQWSTGDEAWDFGITQCKNCLVDWRSSELPCAKATEA